MLRQGEEVVGRTAGEGGAGPCREGELEGHWDEEEERTSEEVADGRWEPSTWAGEACRWAAAAAEGSLVGLLHCSAVGEGERQLLAG